MGKGDSPFFPFFDLTEKCVIIDIWGCLKLSKDEIRKILFSMRTAENEGAVNNLLGKIDLISDSKLQALLDQIGNDEISVRNYLQERLNSRRETKEANRLHGNHETHGTHDHTPVNEMFSYGTSGSFIHLHMPVDLHEMMSEIGILKTIDMVNLYLLDAIERIRKLQKDGFPEFVGKDNIYMISPILVGSEMKFLEKLDFKTKKYRRKELQDNKFVEENAEAALAIKIFGRERNVGTAVISLETVNSDDWQQKRAKQVEEFRNKGIELESELEK